MFWKICVHMDTEGRSEVHETWGWEKDGSLPKGSWTLEEWSEGIVSRVSRAFTPVTSEEIVPLLQDLHPRNS